MQHGAVHPAEFMPAGCQIRLYVKCMSWTTGLRYLIKEKCAASHVLDRLSRSGSE